MKPTPEAAPAAVRSLQPTTRLPMSVPVPPHEAAAVLNCTPKELLAALEPLILKDEVRLWALGGPGDVLIVLPAPGAR